MPLKYFPYNPQNNPPLSKDYGSFGSYLEFKGIQDQDFQDETLVIVVWGFSLRVEGN